MLPKLELFTLTHAQRTGPLVQTDMALNSLAIPIFVLLSALPVAAAEPELRQSVIFKAGEDGYHTFRIPSLLVTRRGTALAFCEGRKHSAGDSGDIDLVLKRSLDGGTTWQTLQVVADHGADTIGNPCPVIDRKTGIIWLLLTGNPGGTEESKILAGNGTRTVWVTSSKDGGATWPPAVDITASVKNDDWTWYATGPGNGIQLRSGRMVVPCCHAKKGGRAYRSHVIYSDDRGKTWRAGGEAGENTDESSVVELADGSLLLNARTESDAKRRSVTRSADGGLTWGPVSLDETLIEPTCQASLIRFGGHGKLPPALLFSNPADLARVKETVRLSYDDGKTWPNSLRLYEGPSAYSSLAILGKAFVGCLYERGQKHPYESIAFARIPLDWLARSSGGSTGR